MFQRWVLFFLVTTASFLCASSGWQLPAADVSSPGTTIANFNPLAQICCYDHNKAIAVWVLSDGSNDRVQSAHYDGFSWTMLGNISIPGQNAFIPQICCLDNGEAVTTWLGNDGVQYYIWVAQFSGSSWSTPNNLATSDGSASSPPVPQICCYDTNKAIVIWNSFDGSNYTVRYSQFDGMNWFTSDITAPSILFAGPQICCFENGSAIAVWQGPGSFVQYSTFNGVTWSGALSISSAPSFEPQICCYDTNKAVAVWRRIIGLNFIVEASHFDGANWSSPVSLSVSGFSISPQICCYENGNAVVVWRNISGGLNIIQASYFNGVNWSLTPYNLSDSSLVAESPQICCFDTNKAMAIWSASNGINDFVQASQFDGSAWSEPQDLAVSLDNPTPQICCYADGNAHAIWSLSDGVNYTVQAALFLAPVSSPGGFSGTRITNRFATQSEIFARLSWSLSTSPNIVSYKIFRNGILIATLSNQINRFENHNLNPNTSYTFSIIAVNEDGVESALQTITL